MLNSCSVSSQVATIAFGNRPVLAFDARFDDGLFYFNRYSEVRSEEQTESTCFRHAKVSTPIYRL